MSPTLTTFLYEAANFGVLALFLSWLFFKPVRRALADQRAQFEDTTRQAEQALAKAESMQADVEAQRKGLEHELGQLRAQEIEAARKQATQIIADAHAAAHRQREHQAREAALLSNDEQERLSRATAVAAGKVVARLLAQIAGPELDTALVRAACQQLESLQPNLDRPLRVESARPLAAESRSQLDTALGPLAAQATYAVDEDLVAGVRISTDKGLVDSSVVGLAAYTREALTKELNHRNNHNRSW